MVARDLGHLAAEGTRTRAHDAPVRGDAVRLGDDGRLVERRAKLPDLGVEVGVQRQLLRHDERRHEEDAGAAIGGEPAGEVDRVHGLVAAEERDDDRAVAHGDGASREPFRAAADRVDVRRPHRKSW